MEGISQKEAPFKVYARMQSQTIKEQNTYSRSLVKSIIDSVQVKNNKVNQPFNQIDNPKEL